MCDTISSAMYWHVQKNERITCIVFVGVSLNFSLFLCLHGYFIQVTSSCYLYTLFYRGHVLMYNHALNSLDLIVGNDYFVPCS
jgi:hypothetical protein